ncbi:MAG: iron ABC transporter permease [Bacteroidales bacterium]|jgi:iron complex transport system permease protein|nr:iron ABC transporter permease [Bacteroidales bacterium]
MSGRRLFISFSLLVIGIVLLLIANVLWGSVLIAPKAIFEVLFFPHDSLKGESLIVWEYRMPQLIVAVFAGAGLAVAGLLLQTLFRNPLADPSILGISSGASFGVALLLFVTGTFAGTAVSALGWIGTLGISLSALAGAIVVLIFLMAVSSKVSHIVSLLIVGIMIAYLAGALTGLLRFYSRKEDIQAFVIWGMGTFSGVSRSQIPYFVLAVSIGLVSSIFLAKPLNMLLLGEQYAVNLGLNTRYATRLIILLAGFLTAIITAYAGPIAFIGLAVPHIARNLFKTSDHLILIPASIGTGVILALFCNLIARLPGIEGSLPINAVTSLIGAPFVIAVILRQHRSNTLSS